MISFIMRTFISVAILSFAFCGKHSTKPEAQDFCCVQIDTTALILPTSTEPVISVSSRIDSLQNVYTVKLKNDTVATVMQPVRIMILLDGSPSMCGSSGNDNTDRRIEAAKLFLDSLLVANPTSEVGVLRFFWKSTFTEGEDFVPPLPINKSENVAIIKAAIDSASCKSHTLSKTGKILVTNTGVAVATALNLVDSNYALIKDSLSRHIIILTDGAWDDSLRMGAQKIIDSYNTKNPGRVPPQIHGVFLSSISDTISLHSDLKRLAVLTGGLYFPGSTATMVSFQLMEILSKLKVVYAQQLKKVTITNCQTGSKSSAFFNVTPLLDNIYSVSAPSLYLINGSNRIDIEMTVEMHDSTSTHDSTITNTIIVIKSESIPFDSLSSNYSVSCK